MASRKKRTPSGGTAPSAWEDFKERVRDASRLEEVVGGDAELAKQGRQLVCRSPIRDGDSTPSFSVNVEKQLWIDRGTGQGGDVFAYVMAREKVGFSDAVRTLARRANIVLPDRARTDHDEKVDEERRLVQKILTDAAAAYHDALDAEHREYLRSHYGFTDKLIDDQKLGYDPGGTTLWYKLKEQGYSDQELYKAGLFVEAAAHVGVSRFHHRLTMPYWRRGAVVYFCARATKDTPKLKKRKEGDVVRDADGNEVLLDPPKYLKLKTNDDPDDMKPGEVRSSISKTISNEWFAGEDCCDRPVAVLLIAEGMPDFLSVLQFGYSVISPVTTRFREQDQPKLLRLCRRAGRVCIVPDQEANGAGMAGAMETAGVLARAGVDARVVVLPHEALEVEAGARVAALKARKDQAPGDDELKKAGAWKVDANEFLRDHPSGTEFRALVDQAPPLVQFLIERVPATLRGADLDAALRPVLELVARIESPIQREHYLDQIKRRFETTKAALRVALRAAESPPDDEEADGDTKAQKVFEMLSELALVRAPTGRVFAVFGSQAVPTDSAAFVRTIARMFHAKTDQLVSASTIETALLPLLGGDIPTGPVAIRYAYDADGAIVVDLGDTSRRVVRITASGCELLAQSPVAFYRPDGMRALPSPEFPVSDDACAGVLDEFQRLLGFTRADFVSAFIWNIDAMRPMEPSHADDEDDLTEYPLLKLVGGEGSGKTGAAKAIRRAVDPRVPDAMSLRDNLKDLAISAENARALVFDNVSFVPRDMSDGMCRVSTGDGMEVRGLYTDRDLAVFRGSTPVIVTSITDVVTEADLLNRCLSVRLPVRETRKTKRALARAFRALHPRLFGALCYCASRALRDLDGTEVPESIRMQDAGQFALAAAAAAGIAAEEIENAFARATDDADVTVAEDPVVEALDAVVSAYQPWTGTTGDLLDALTGHASDVDLDSGKPRKKLPKHWPETARGLSAKLRRLEPTLKRAGYTIEFPTGSGSGKGGKQRVLTVTRAAEVWPDLEDAGSDGRETNRRREPSEKSEPKAASPDGPAVPTVSGVQSGDSREQALASGAAATPSSQPLPIRRSTVGIVGSSETAVTQQDPFRRSVPTIVGTAGTEPSETADQDLVGRHKASVVRARVVDDLLTLELLTEGGRPVTVVMRAPVPEEECEEEFANELFIANLGWFGPVDGGWCVGFPPTQFEVDVYAKVDGRWRATWARGEAREVA